MRHRPSFWNRAILGACFFSVCAALVAQDNADLKRQLDEVREQNRALQTQLQQQQKMLEDLTRQFSKLQQTNQAQQDNYQALRDVVEGNEAPKKPAFSIGNAIISGEGGVGFFDSQRGGDFPHDELLVDEARLFIEAPLMDDIYFYGQLDLRSRDLFDDGVHLGELYVDFENVSRFWGPDSLVNVRLGQLYSPFGEEYQNRFAFDNPLISHSLSDVWALEGGAEVYGSWKKFCYAVAVQSGDLDVMHDHTSDKTVVARVGFDPTAHLHFSLSGQRTGSLDTTADPLAGSWFGNAFFVSIGSPATTRYHVDMGELDGRYSWKNGYVAAAGGYAAYGDNDPLADNHRDIYYYYLEGTQKIWSKLYGAARFSQVLTPGGYPVVGGSGEYGVPTEEVWRLSLGLDYKVNQHVILKSEYSFEHGQRHDGTSRSHLDLFALEAVFKF
ncbi:MAG TPA: hypothetical protein VHB20_07590 [Verrucomicrobiae bacterium]|jgi:hypothetical protein|nr:hypothetical protein [Verrucomicrobiae bacterium]